MSLPSWIQDRLQKMLEDDDELLRGLRFLLEEAEKSSAPTLLESLAPFSKATHSVPDSVQERNWDPGAYQVARKPLRDCAEKARQAIRELLSRS